MSDLKEINRDWHGRIIAPNENSFKKGMIPWNKGKKGLFKNPLKGKKMPAEWRAKLQKPKSVKKVVSEETKRKLSIIMSQKIGPLSSRWKGGNANLEHNRKRRTRILKNGGSHTLAEWEALKMKYRYMCLCCKRTEPEVRLTRDHIIPISKGGTDDILNIQPLCDRCNVKKFTKIAKYEYVS